MTSYRSRLSPRFLKFYRALPKEIREKTRRTYRQWQQNPALPWLRFKRVGINTPTYSVRVDTHYRVTGDLEGDMVTWTFIGNHADYMREIAHK